MKWSNAKSLLLGFVLFLVQRHDYSYYLCSFFLIISTGSAESCPFHFLYNLLFFLICQQFFDLSLYLHMFGLERTWRVIKITMLSRRIHAYIRITLSFRSSCHHLACLDHRCAPPCSQFLDSGMLGKHSTNCAPSQYNSQFYIVKVKVKTPKEEGTLRCIHQLKLLKHKFNCQV